MLTSEDVTRLLSKESDAITSRIIKDLIKDFEIQSLEMKKFYERYKGNVPIKNRKLPSETAIEPINNKINVDYEGIIIDEIVGYIWGKEIKVSYDSPNEVEKELVMKKIRDISILNNLPALDEESGELSCCCGYATRLIYIDRNANIKIMNTFPWETIIVYNNSTGEADYALIFYDWTIVDEFGNSKKTVKVEFYNREEVSYWIKDGDGFRMEKFIDSGLLVESEYKNPQPHMFDGVPVIKFKGNNNEQSDLYKATSLIDAYNELISDAQNEAQEFVHAYLKTIGAEINAEERIAARRSRVFNLPDKDSDVDFITKNINGEFFEAQKKTLDEKIFLTTKTVNMNDEKFSSGGSESGEARKWKLLALEFKAIKKERKFSEGLRTMWSLISSNLALTKFILDPLLLSFTFFRSLPIDFLYYADIATKYRGTLPLEDILKLIPFIDNVQSVMQRLKEENETNFDNIPSEKDLNSMIDEILKNKGTETATP